MPPKSLLVVFFAALSVSSSKEQTRWSRQISSYTSDLSDWVPLSGPYDRPEQSVNLGPIKRQAVAQPRVLAEPFPGFARPTGFSQEGLPPRSFNFQNAANRQLYLQSVPSVPSAPQNFLNEQGFGQSIRFGLSQPNFPLSQGFVAPQFNFDYKPQQRYPQNPVSFPKSNHPLSPQAKPFVHMKPTNQAPKFVDGYKAENASRDFDFSLIKPQSLQKMKYDSFDKPRFQDPMNNKKLEREEVQLLYVPVDSLNQGKFNFRSPLSNTQKLNNEFYSQSQSLPKQKPLPNFASQEYAPKPRPVEPFNQNQNQNFNFGPNYFSEFSRVRDFDQIPKYSTVSSPFPTLPPSTPKPKKLKPHQPPLAVFLAQEAKKGEKIKVGDVLSSLKNAQSIAVLDSVNPLNSPKVFIGPSSLTPPENYVKFELPYLSNIEHSDKKIKQLPFFVAPLSYSTPNGFAKIPFPSPHVGSVIVNAQIKETAEQVSTPVADVIPNSYTAAPPVYKQEQKPQKPTFSYYSTVAPKANPPRNQFQANYYSIEPQTVTSLRPKEQEPSVVTAAPKPGSYYLENQQYDLQRQKIPSRNEYHSNRNQQPVRGFNNAKQTTTTAASPKPSRRPSSPAPSTFPSQLLETHNPYSINQAFQPSTSVDYQNFNFEDTYATSGYSSTPSPPTPTPPKQEEISETPYQQSSPNYSQQPSPKYSQQSSPNYSQQSTPKYSQQSLSNYNEPSPVKPSSNYNEQSASISNQPSPPTYNQQSTSDYNQQPSLDYNLQSASPDYKQQSLPNYSQESSPNYSRQPSTNYNQLNYNQPSTATYLQNYSPEIHYQTEIQNSRFPTYSEYTNNPETITQKPTDYKEVDQVSQYITNNLNTTEGELQISNVPESFDNAEYNLNNNEESSSTSTTTTTTTRRPIRTRGRPRSTTPRTEVGEGRTTTTRRPLRERRPLPTRSRYEPNKITTERATKRPGNEESQERTTRPTRTRTRGKVQYRPSDNEELYSNKKQGSKEADLAYQRDVLHQNYPVTLMERMSTADIEAMTEPAVKISSTRNLEPITEVYDTAHAYSNEQAFTQNNEHIYTEAKETVAPFYSRSLEVQTETPSYVPKFKASSPEIDNEDLYIPRSNPQPTESSFEESSRNQEENTHIRNTTPFQRTERPEIISIATEPSGPLIEQSIKYSVNNEFEPSNTNEDITGRPDFEINKSDFSPSEIPTTEEPIQTTQSHRIRVRPGIRNFPHQSVKDTTQSNKPKVEIRRRPSQAVTYRPAFDKRRTTMRIDEIEADLKTKQIRARPEIQERHPVYRPEPTTESITTIANEATSRRNSFRRRRPSYTTTTTETTANKKPYETKNRFKGRRPAEKTTEKEIQETTTSTTRTIPYSRYSKPRLSERFNRKPIQNEEDDQETNHSINIPKYVDPEEEDSWSPKITSSESFKPYNPNNIQDDAKIATTERKEETDIITARNDYENVLISVTPASNKLNKNIPEIPPTIEALVEQSKTTTSESLSTFESMLEQVMKTLEEQDQDEYSSNVLKRQGGEIGEIPPEKVIAEGDNDRRTTVEAAVTTEAGLSPENDEETQKPRRRGFWKKVNRRPITTDNIETAESQYYTNTVNHLGQPIHSETKDQKTKVTTYKPNFDFIKDLFNEDQLDITEEVIEKLDQDIAKIPQTTTPKPEIKATEVIDENGTETTKEIETTTTEASMSTIDRSDAFSFMDYLFGVTSGDAGGDKQEDKPTSTTTEGSSLDDYDTKRTTESNYVPDELTTLPTFDFERVDKVTVNKSADSNPAEVGNDVKKTQEDDYGDLIKTIYSDAKEPAATESSYMDPAMVMSTSMSTEISHETEICFRGKCIKTNKDFIY